LAARSPDSEARRAGHDFMDMTCSETCARSLKTAFERDLEMGKGLKDKRGQVDLLILAPEPGRDGEGMGSAVGPGQG